MNYELPLQLHNKKDVHNQTWSGYEHPFFLKHLFFLNNVRLTWSDSLWDLVEPWSTWSSLVFVDLV
jgi:hypothetical protein